MEFHISIGDPQLAVGPVERVVQAFDPATVVDIDPAGATLRVAAAVDVAELLLLFSRAGHPVARDHVVQVPSTCCGGCSG